MYNPPGPVDAFKAHVRLAAGVAYKGAPFGGPVRVDLHFMFPRPKNKIWKKRAMLPYRHIKKPDKDNLEKSVYDALTGLLWIDDCQICDGRTQKWVISGDERPGVRISIRELRNET